MNTLLGVICGLLAILVFAMSTYLKKSFQDGYASGYEQGRLVADNWWFEVEAEVDQVREKIWREEAQL